MASRRGATPDAALSVQAPDLRSLAGHLLGLMVVLTVVHGLAPQWLPAWPAGLAAWLAGVVLWPRLSRVDRLQSAVLVALGALGMAVGLRAGAELDWHAVLVRNHALLAMLAAVSFLRLLRLVGGDAERPVPVGFGAFLRSMLGVHLFGATINMSAVFIVGDRLAAHAPMTLGTQVALARCFTAGALYSPFFAAMGVVLVYVPEAHFATLVATGLPIALFSMLYAVAAAWLGSADRLASFAGYPLTVASLWVPAVLAVGVLVMHAALPRVSVLVVIAALAPLLALLTLLVRDGRRRCLRELQAHLRAGLPQMGGLLALFLSAAVLATGIDAILMALPAWLPFEQFDNEAALVTLLSMAALAAVGVHPLILVAAIAAWLAPLRPPPDLLATVFLIAWGSGGTLNPLSGVHLAMAARYRLPNWRVPLINLPFAMVVIAFSYGVLLLRG